MWLAAVLALVTLRVIQCDPCVMDAKPKSESQLVTLAGITNKNLSITQLALNLDNSNCTLKLIFPNGTSTIVNPIKPSIEPQLGWHIKSNMLYFKSNISEFPDIGEYELRSQGASHKFYHFRSQFDQQESRSVFGEKKFVIPNVSKKFKTCLSFLVYRKLVLNKTETLRCEQVDGDSDACLVSNVDNGTGLQVDVRKWKENAFYKISCSGLRQKPLADMIFMVQTPQSRNVFHIILFVSCVLSLILLSILCWFKLNCFWRGQKPVKNEKQLMVPYLENTTVALDSMEDNPEFDDLEYDWPQWILDAPDLLRVSMRAIRKHDELGHGHFGTVYNGSVNIQSLSCPVAIKELKSGISQKEILDEAEKLWQVRDHGHIVALQCVSKELIDGGTYRYALVMSLESEMNLAKYLRKHESLLNLQEQKLVSWMYQVSDGLDYLSERNIVHFDLAARNILLTTGTEIAKISDFGLAKFIHEIPALSQKTREMMLPVDRLPLEVIHNLSLASASTDVWSFGILLWEVFSFGSRPYDWEFHHSSSISSSYSRVTSGLINQSESNARFNFIIEFLSAGNRLSSPWDRRSNSFLPNHQDLYRIMLKCWHANPLERPFAHEIRQQISVHLVQGAKAANESNVAREKDDYIMMKKQLENEVRRTRNHTH